MIAISRLRRVIGSLIVSCFLAPHLFAGSPSADTFKNLRYEDVATQSDRADAGVSLKSVPLNVLKSERSLI